MTGRVDIVEKTVKVYGKLLKNVQKWSFFFGPLTSILNFLHFSQKLAEVYRPFRSFCLLFVFFADFEEISIWY